MVQRIRSPRFTASWFVDMGTLVSNAKIRMISLLNVPFVWQLIVDIKSWIFFLQCLICRLDTSAAGAPSSKPLTTIPNCRNCPLRDITCLWIHRFVPFPRLRSFEFWNGKSKIALLLWSERFSLREKEEIMFVIDRCCEFLFCQIGLIVNLCDVENFFWIPQTFSDFKKGYFPEFKSSLSQ